MQLTPLYSFWTPWKTRSSDAAQDLKRGPAQAAHVAPGSRNEGSRKKPARPCPPAVRPEPGRGKASGGAEERHGLLDAGKAGSDRETAQIPARLGNLREEFGYHCWYRFRCPARHHGAPARATPWGPVHRTTPAVPPATPPRGGAAVVGAGVNGTCGYVLRRRTSGRFSVCARPSVRRRSPAP